jgi:hypothetical protein
MKSPPFISVIPGTEIYLGLAADDLNTKFNLCPITPASAVAYVIISDPVLSAFFRT